MVGVCGQKRQDHGPPHLVEKLDHRAFGGPLTESSSRRGLSPMNHDRPITRGLGLGVLDDVGLTGLSLAADESQLVHYE